ncbi:MAG: DUF4105 domain-containing protein [Bacteroidetes bacterium]|nr:DUF4105 domain-containing protein [Bacteroidota bacterium]MDA0859681.1 DUF4105 domain-containing protein [Bacteroidota bacterium]MDA1317733.1 DUF4105 domain-containing protein [Bacteroidota bacterium]
MKKLHYFLFFFATLFSMAYGQIQLSEYSEVSILTIGPGASLNDAFGHSAIHIKDPMYRLDIVYDYGRYDFETEGFYLNFAKGKLNYEIGAANYKPFISYYKSKRREVKSQTLNLSLTEKQALFQKLQQNILPQNKRYLYDFFYNNCATKIKDNIVSVSEKPIEFEQPKDFEQHTFRALIRSQVEQNSWGGFGIDLALGSIIDQVAPVDDHMFLPRYIHHFFEVAKFKNTNEPLIKKQEILSGQQLNVTHSFWSSPLFIFSILSFLILLVTYKNYKSNTRTKWLDISIFSVTGLIGVLLLLLWFATDHTATAYNYNLLWAFAFNLLFIPTLLKKRVKKRFVGYLKFLILMMFLMALHWSTGVQSFNIGLIPVCIAILLRYTFLSYWFGKNLTQEK